MIICLISLAGLAVVFALCKIRSTTRQVFYLVDLDCFDPNADLESALKAADKIMYRHHGVSCTSMLVVATRGSSYDIRQSVSACICNKRIEIRVYEIGEGFDGPDNEALDNWIKARKYEDL